MSGLFVSLRERNKANTEKLLKVSELLLLGSFSFFLLFLYNSRIISTQYLFFLMEGCLFPKGCLTAVLFISYITPEVM